MITVEVATLEHRPELVDLLVQFADETPVHYLNDPVYDAQHMMRTIDKIQSNGLVMVAIWNPPQEPPQVVGTIMGAIVEDIWLPNVRILREIAWYVLPEYRKTSAGLRLLKQYSDIADIAINSGHIRAAQLTTLSTSPKLNLQKRGWQLVEQNWIKEI